MKKPATYPEKGKTDRHVRQSLCMHTTKNSCGARGYGVDLGSVVPESEPLEQCCTYHPEPHVEKTCVATS